MLFLIIIFPARTEFGSQHAGNLEKWIDELDSELPELTNFILPVHRTIKTKF